MAAASIHIPPECSICCLSFETPKILQCGHTFCKDCIEQYIGDQTEVLLCPICGQNVKIPEGGAKMFITNLIVQTTTQGVKVSTTQPHTSNVVGTPTPHTTKESAKSVSPVDHYCLYPERPVDQYCPYHERPVNHYCPYHELPVDYYCISCHSLMCHKCFVKDHHGHEYLDVECETTKERAKELVSSSEKFIQDKIKELEETHTTFVEASKKLSSYTEDACRRITQQTEKIIADIKTSSKRAILDIRNKFEESDCKLTRARENIMEQMKNVKLDLETNLPSLSDDSCVQILASIPKIKELEKLCESMKNNSPVLYKYMDWEERNFRLDIGMLGSVVTKSYYMYSHKHNSFRFRFDIDKMDTRICYSVDRSSFNGTEIEFCCSAWNCGERDQQSFFQTAGFSNTWINIELSNAGMDYCIVDGQLSLLNIVDDSKTLTTSFSNQKLTTGFSNWAGKNAGNYPTSLFGTVNQKLTTGDSNWVWKNAISWNKLMDGRYGYLTLNNQFIVQFDITLIRDISFK